MDNCQLIVDGTYSGTLSEDGTATDGTVSGGTVADSFQLTDGSEQSSAPGNFGDKGGTTAKCQPSQTANSQNRRKADLATDSKVVEMVHQRRHRADSRPKTQLLNIAFFLIFFQTFHIHARTDRLGNQRSVFVSQNPVCNYKSFHKNP